MSRRRIFVSSTNRDLQSFRKLAVESLRKRGYDVDDEAIFNLTYLEIHKVLKRRIADCDAVVCLIGFYYGGEPSQRPPDQPRRSYTQWEYFFAEELGKPVYRLLADQKTPFDPHEPESETTQQLQLEYSSQVVRDRDWRSFNSVDQLRAELAELRFPWEEPPPDHTPCNLPLASIGTRFKGREAFLDHLRQRLGVSEGRAAAIVNRLAVHGLGGVGKTRAAVEYALRHGDKYTALLFVSAPTPGELWANLANLVGVLGIKADGMPVDRQLAAVLDWLNAHPGWLLIVDNVDTEEAAEEIERLLARLRAGSVLITSRVANWSASMEPLELDVLAPADAEAFLLARTPHRRKAADDVVQVAAVARELDGLGLALEQAGAYIDKLRLSFAEYLRRWEAKRPEVLRWHDLRLMQYQASVAVTWETTFAQLTETERRLLDLLSWLAPEPIPLSLFEAEPLLIEIPDPQEAIAGLAGYSLVRFDTSGDTFLVHRLVQEITRGRIPKAHRTAKLQIALEAVDAVAAEDPSDVRNWVVWTPLAPHADVISRSADAEGLGEPTAGLMYKLGSYRYSRGQFGAAEPLYRRALAIDEASYGTDHPTVAIDLSNLATLLRDTNRLVAAELLYRRAVAILDASFGPDHPTLGRGLNNLADLLGATNRLAEAEPLFRRALAIDEASFGPDHPTVAIGLNNLASVMYATNRLAEAEPLFRRALAIDKASFGPDHPTVANGLNNLASVLYATNRLAEAMPLLRQALAINEASYGPDHPEVATGLNNLAALLRDSNRLAEAEPLFRRAAKLLCELQGTTGHEHPQGRSVRANYQRVLEALGKTPDQIEHDLNDLKCPPQSDRS